MHVALILGAGASLANAKFFRSERKLDTHPPLDTTFFQKLRVRDVGLHPALRTYFRRLTGSDPTQALVEPLRMEEFFKDLYYDFQDNPTDPNLRRAYIELTSAYTRVLRETTNWLCEDSRQGAPIGKLIAAAADVAGEVSIITFNHDLVIENELLRRARLRDRWCLERGYASMETVLEVLGSSAAELFPRHATTCDHRRPIRLHKLHGSLNWIFRLRGRMPSSNQLTGLRTPPQLFLTHRRQIPTRLRYTSNRPGPGRGSWQTWPLIIPPIYAKQALIHLVQPAWSDARSALERSDRIVFFGYSMPPADIEAAKLFQRAINANGTVDAVDVINPDPGSAATFAHLAPKKPLRWYPSSEVFLSHHALAD